VGAAPGHRLVPGVIARVQMRFDEARAGLVHDQEYEAVLVPIPDAPTPEQFRAVDYDDRDLLAAPPPGATYRLPPAGVASKSWWTDLQRDLADHLVRSMTVELPTNPELKLFGRVGETTEEFAVRCTAAAADAADRQIATLQAKYASKLAALQARLATAEQAVAREESARNATLASDAVGGLLGGLFGGRRTSMSTAARRATSAQGRVSAAQDNVAELERGLVDLQVELDAESAAIRAEWDARAGALAPMTVTLEKADVRVSAIGLVWVPMGT
jgi:phage host-nuclease inhibitor protein Gam